VTKPLANPTPPSATTRAEAYRHLGVDPNEVATLPRLARRLESIGGKRKALDILRSSTHPHARQFLSIYDSLLLPNFVRARLPLEAFCVASSVTPEQLLIALASTVREMSQLEASVIAAEAHPRIVHESSLLAVAGDLDHATLNMKHMGFLPAPKGSQVSVNVHAQANAASQSIAAASPAPSPENTIRRLVNRFNTSLPTADAPALPAASVPADPFPRSSSADPATIDADYASSSDDDGDDD